MKKLKIAVLCGGISQERDISLKTGKSVFKHLSRWKDFEVELVDLTRKNYLNRLIALKKKKIDIVYIGLHGKFGEDGIIQGILDSFGIKYTGSGRIASSICMNKHYTKMILKANKIPTPDWILLKKSEKFSFENIKFPVIVKPVEEGSTIGVGLARNIRDLRKGIEKAFEYGDKIIIEKYIVGRELTVPILGKKILPIVEIIPKLNTFYDYNSKYKPAGSTHIIPAKLADITYRKVEKIAKMAADATGCEVMCRVDIILERITQRPYVLEINTIPGMTSTSLFPESAKICGISFQELVKEIILMSMKKYG
ncbi:MAG: D-alanine--D-alanine ligase [Endomicrobia bacterium]|nr:D-alanine--D-alanine ligase [Endomicrobiia bacterium]